MLIRFGFGFGVVLATMCLAWVQVTAEEGEKKAKAKPEAKAKPKVQAPPGYEDAAQANAPARPVLEAGGMVAEALEEKFGLGVVDANVRNLEQQFLPQFQPLVNAEFSFLRRVCKPTAEQRQELALQREACARLVARKYALGQNQVRRGVRVVNGQVAVVAARQVSLDPQTLVEEQLLSLAREKLTDEQAASYGRELEQRKANRQRAAILNLVVWLDEHLALSAEQRAQLTESLTANWQNTWAPPLETFLQHNSQQLPALSDQFVLPILNEPQREVWRKVSKVFQSHWGGGFGVAQHMGGVVDDFDKADPAEARE